MLLDSGENKDIEAMSDEELLERSLTHPSMFAHLVARYEKAFLRKGGRILHNTEETQDAVQEAFTKIYLAAPRFKHVEGASFQSWAYKILLNTCFSAYRKLKRRGEITAPLPPEMYEALPEKSFREQHELQDMVARALTKMPQVLARVLHAQFLEGKTQQEIAREEGISVGAVKTRVYRAKRMFRTITE